MMASQKILGSLIFTSALVMAGCALAKSPLPSMGGKHNNKAPIEINADSLEVLQDKSMAVFSGHVVAIQGEVRLKAEKMTVYYKPSDENPAATKKTDKPKSDDKQGAIQKIETDGGVFLSTAQETASGANGTYDVEHQMIHLNNNVVLTRGQNVLKGDKLTYNFATGKSVITGGGATQPNGKKGERVRALFIPGSESKPKD
jgi:lipopolysaccharide export system protein LptA